MPSSTATTRSTPSTSLLTEGEIASIACWSDSELETVFRRLPRTEAIFLARRIRAHLDPTASPADFAIKASRGKWRPARHLDLLNRAILDTINGVDGIRQLIVEMPPRHGKSELISKFTPAWFEGKYPEKRSLLTCYGEKLTRRYGRATRDLLSEWGPNIFGLQVRGDNKASDSWGIEGHSGGLEAAGCMGTVTGLGADLLIVDDPIKNAEEANSVVYRDKLWDWWESTAFTRLEPGSAVIVLHTRWNHDDLIGRLLKAEQESGKKQWRRLTLAAIDECGAALWPDRFPIESLEAKRLGMTSYWWSALYQQNPTPREGLFFRVDKLDIVEAAPVGIKLVRAWDSAASDGKGAFSAGVKLGRDDEGTFYVCDVSRGQWDTDTRNNTIKQCAEIDGRQVRIRLPQDPGSAGKDVAKGWVRMLAGFSVKAEPVSGTKELRADGFSAQVNAGNVKLVRGPWNKDFIEELRTFPAGANDDQVDAASDAFNEITQRRGFFVA